MFYMFDITFANSMMITLPRESYSEGRKQGKIKTIYKYENDFIFQIKL